MEDTRRRLLWHGLLLLYGAYANWATVLFAAVVGTGALMPLAAPDHEGQPWQEGLVTVVLVTVALAVIPAVALLLLGTRRSAARG